MARGMTRRDPVSRLIELCTRFDHVFDDLETAREGTSAPAVDLVPDGDARLVRAELSRIKSEELTIDVEGNLLTVSGQQEASQEEKGCRGTYLLRERRTGGFRRLVALPPDVDVRPEQNKGETHRIVTLAVPVPKDYLEFGTPNGR